MQKRCNFKVSDVKLQRAVYNGGCSLHTVTVIPLSVMQRTSYTTESRDFVNISWFVTVISGSCTFITPTSESLEI